MRAILAIIGGLLFGMLFFPRVLSWIYGIYEIASEYRTAVNFPHLNRRPILWPIAIQLFFNSGSWILAAAVVATCITLTGNNSAEWYWFMGAFYAYSFLMAGFVIYALCHQYNDKKENEKP